MQKSIIKASFWSGLLSFIIISIPLIGKGGSYIALAIYLPPGFIYGMVLIAYCKKGVSTIKGILFIILSVAINFFCALLVGYYFLDEHGPRAANAPLILVTSSAVGAVLLSVCYDLLLVRRFSVFYSISMPVIVGIVSSLISAACMYSVVFYKHNDFVSTLLFMGIMTIFPLWQYFFGINIKNHNKSVLAV